MIPNRTCTVNVPANEGNCPIFQDISFEDIIATGAQRAGDIHGFEGDLLRGLSFRNVVRCLDPVHCFPSVWADCRGEMWPDRPSKRSRTAVGAAGAHSAIAFCLSQILHNVQCHFFPPATNDISVAYLTTCGLQLCQLDKLFRSGSCACSELQQRRFAAVIRRSGWVLYFRASLQQRSLVCNGSCL